MSLRRIVSVSLGSSERDHEAETEFLGQRFWLRRVGTDGDLDRARSLLEELDGTVDAIGLGGVDVYLRTRQETYTLRDGLRLMQVVKKTPVVDGSGLKDTLERSAVEWLVSDGQVPLAGRKTLMVCALDRFGMAEALLKAGARVVFGDMIFTLGVNKPITSLEELESYARKLLPEICKLPISLVYPIGKKQSEIRPDSLTGPYYQEAEVLAGDFHFIRRRMPDRLEGKTVLTNTVTARDVQELHNRGVHWLVTTTPELSGRSFGTNVLEAALVALGGDYAELTTRLGLKPRVVDLREVPPSTA